MKLFLKRYWPTLCVAAVILYATLSSDPLPDTELPPLPYLDKLVHAIMFGGLCGAWFFDIYRSGARLTVAKRLLVAAICVVLGGLDELMQLALTDNRAADILDWGADILGVAVAYFAAPPAVRAVVRKR